MNINFLAKFTEFSQISKCLYIPKVVSQKVRLISFIQLFPFLPLHIYIYIMQSKHLILLTILSIALLIPEGNSCKAQEATYKNEKVRFTDVTTEIGIRFRDVNGESGKKILH